MESSSKLSLLPGSVNISPRTFKPWTSFRAPGQNGPRQSPLSLTSLLCLLTLLVLLVSSCLTLLRVLFLSWNLSLLSIAREASI